MTTAKAKPVKPAVPNVLYHYTCRDHGEPGIAEKAKLLPHKQLLLGRNLVWLTDMPVPDAWALGLTNYLLCCDRTETQVTVRPTQWTDRCGIQPWWYYRRTVHPALREALEQTGMLMHWWVTEHAVPISDITPTAPARKARKANTVAHHTV